MLLWFVCLLVGLEPVLSETGIGNERDVQGEGILHLFNHDTLHLFLLLWIDAEVEFVVYLKDHLALDALGLKALENVDHGYLDDIGSCALDRCVDGVALSKAANGGVVGVDIRQIASTAE